MLPLGALLVVKDLRHGRLVILDAPDKSFSWFEFSAHDLQFDEPGKFSETVIRISREIMEEQ